MEERKKCRNCQVEQVITEFYTDPKKVDGRSSRCKTCHKAYSKRYNMKPFKDKKWNKTNKNHYPDSDWVWQQLENGVTGLELYDKIDKKYELKAHGNKGKKHKTTWDRRRNGGGKTM